MMTFREALITFLNEGKRYGRIPDLRVRNAQLRRLWLRGRAARYPLEGEAALFMNMTPAPRYFRIRGRCIVRMKCGIFGAVRVWRVVE